MNDSIAAIAAPMFPAEIGVGDARITLHADGSWSGDRDKFIAELKEAKQVGYNLMMPTLWLVENAISRDGKT